ncbi:hypothetical protein GUJ93_ZPchr0007g3020 [Zizania palustris]|uniref:GDSL esterase/lipase n=1 Tax=Zizania palustris TaxID=103762 RepID=A0A8J5T4D0_ZIZPA|nr:hypothetical protein GUJ93_ZPchr0007g3020 [Zizania palustris]KAG8079560.1 hypothetical protein GUJ93_ZPchr0007g3020 [Zizania palustris]
MEHKTISNVSLTNSNDYLHPLFQNKTLEWVRPLVPRVVRSIARSVEALIELGATTVYVPGLFPLGCVPRLLFLFRAGGAGDHDPATGCLRGLNEGLAVPHNRLLVDRLAQLRAAHPSVTIAYADYYAEVLALVAAPARSGFDASAALAACCGGGGPYNGNFTVHCTEPGAVQCPDPSTHLSWDGLHMTEAVYRIMARGVLDGPNRRRREIVGSSRVDSPSCRLLVASEFGGSERRRRSALVAIAMDEKEFRRTLELFPVVRSRDYCAESGSSSKGTTQQSRAQEAKGTNKKESDGTEGDWQTFIPLLLILPTFNRQLNLQ